ncbi:MAG: insulinase family protein, partial [Bacteroidales bacterium]|nr:insulinase family protein [Bacteroidales bacterium]
SDFLISPSLSAEELQIIKDKEKQSFLIRMQKVKTIASRQFQQTIFGENHPYGRLGKHSDYDAVKADNLKHFFNSNYKLKDWHLYVSGKVNEDTLQILNRYFGEHEITGQKLEDIKVNLPKKTENIHQFIAHKGAMQTALKIGQITIDRKHKDYPLLSLAQTILGGFFGSRLMQNIREDKGYTYGIGSGIMHLQQASVFTISSEVGSEVAEKALEEVKKEMKLLRTEKIGEAELQLVKNYMAGSLLKSLNGPFALGEMMRTSKEYKLPKDYFTSFISSIQAANSKDVLRMAELYLNENDMLSLLVGTK